MNNYVRFATVDIDHITSLVDSGVNPDDIGQELAEFLNAVMPFGISVEVSVLLGHDAHITMRDGMTGVEIAGAEFWLDELQGLRRQAQWMLDELEAMAATTDVGLSFIPFAERTRNSAGEAVREALQSQVDVGVHYVGTTTGIAIYRVGAIPGVVVGVEMSKAHTWASVLDEHVYKIPAMRKVRGEPRARA